MPGSSSSSPSSPPAGSAGFSGFAASLSARWRSALLRFALALVVASTAWAVVAPVYARGLALLARPLIGWTESGPGTVYDVEGSRVLANRPSRLAGSGRPIPVVQPLWVGAQSFGLPLFSALVLAVPGWSWRRRGRALAIGLLMLSATQVAQLFVTIEATQQSPFTTPQGPIELPRYTPARQAVFYALYYFFELMSRGFFALLAFAALVALLPEARASAPNTGARRNDPCPCGSGLKFKRCHGR